jgi:hypothetical protein
MQGADSFRLVGRAELRADELERLFTAHQRVFELL